MVGRGPEEPDPHHPPDQEQRDEDGPGEPGAAPGVKRSGSSTAGPVRVRERRRRTLSGHQKGISRRHAPGRDQRLPVSRSPAHVRVPFGHGRGRHPDGSGLARSQGHKNDPALQSSLGHPSPGRGPKIGTWHQFGTAPRKCFEGLVNAGLDLRARSSTG